jgi:hypothetical protein
MQSRASPHHRTVTPASKGAAGNELAQDLKSGVAITAGQENRAAVSVTVVPGTSTLSVEWPDNPAMQGKEGTSWTQRRDPEPRGG